MQPSPSPTDGVYYYLFLSNGSGGCLDVVAVKQEAEVANKRSRYSLSRLVFYIQLAKVFSDFE